MYFLLFRTARMGQKIHRPAAGGLFCGSLWKRDGNLFVCEGIFLHEFSDSGPRVLDMN